ncbi:hypothetical protein [Streptomyces sp. NPDC059278]|uniref:hypothetical protein n=1 Tax=Streptomyces sp. NPDC059278 TaxID=3346801 RepID=UPI0036AEEE26
MLEPTGTAVVVKGPHPLHIGMAEPAAALERFFVVSETVAVLLLPSFHEAEGFG